MAPPPTNSTGKYPAAAGYCSAQYCGQNGMFAEEAAARVFAVRACTAELVDSVVAAAEPSMRCCSNCCSAECWLPCEQSLSRHSLLERPLFPPWWREWSCVVLGATVVAVATDVVAALVGVELHVRPVLSSVVGPHALLLPLESQPTIVELALLLIQNARVVREYLPASFLAVVLRATVEAAATMIRRSCEATELVTTGETSGRSGMGYVAETASTSGTYLSGSRRSRRAVLWMCSRISVLHKFLCSTTRAEAGSPLGPPILFHTSITLFTVCRERVGIPG